MKVLQTPVPGDLVLVRHGQSEGNAANIFTGRRDLPLTERGRRQARVVADTLTRSHVHIDVALSSQLIRAQDSARLILAQMGANASLVVEAGLNERDYGELTGLNKDEARTRFGADQVRIWRRSYRGRPPGGETLEDTAQRVSVVFDCAIRPWLSRGHSCLVVAHGNSLRALIMRVEGLSGDEISSIELATSEIRLYRRCQIQTANPHLQSVTLSAPREWQDQPTTRGSHG